MPTGVVKWFDEKKGFGFIKPDNGSADRYMHASGLREKGTFDALQEGEHVEFEMGPDPRNPDQERAIDVARIP